MRASIDIRLRRQPDGTVVAHGCLASPPLWCRWDGATLWLVGSAASPVGDDRVELHLDVGPGVRAAVRSVAASIVYTGTGDGTSTHTSVRIGSGAQLDWRPEPVILTAGARHRSSTRVDAVADSVCSIDEVVAFGRAGERGGVLRSSVELAIDGRTTLLTAFDTSLPGWDGPGGVDGRPITATRLGVGLVTGDSTCASDLMQVLEPEHGGRLAVCAAHDVTAARRLLDGAIRMSPP